MKGRRLGFLVLLIACTLLSVFYGSLKAGFHEDEYYSYFSTNRTAGLFTPDREWQDTDTIRKEFMVLPGEGFQYGKVAQVQSWDVHPPFYYFVLHTVCSFTPNLFTKWQGICANLIAYVLAFFVLYALTGKVGLPDPLRLLACAVWGIHPMTISANLFIRMYMWLTLFVLVEALLHLELFQSIRKGETVSLKVLIFLGLADLCGFLTHYYYLIAAFFFGLATLLVMIRFVMKKGQASGQDRGKARALWKLLLPYAIARAAGFLLAVLIYPSSLRHILAGNRGKEAAAAFFSGTDTLGRLNFFGRLLHFDLFSGLTLLLAVLFALMIWLSWRASGKGKEESGLADPLILLGVSLFYLLLVAKTALILGETSNRYMLPVYPLVLAGLIATAYRLYQRNPLPLQKGLLTALAVLLILVDFKGLALDKNVLFLYPGDANRVAFARTHRDKPVLIYYNDLTAENVWWLTDELLEYPRLYFVSEKNTAPFTDETILQAEEIVVYAADHDNRDKLLKELLKDGKGVSSCKKVAEKNMWTTYLLSGK